MDTQPKPTPTAARLVLELAGFTVLLFVARFVAQGHLIPQLDEECTVGAVSVEVLAHGVRFPLSTYAPNEYENGFFFSGLLTALSFSLLGRNVLSLKLVTHLILAAGAVATLWLLRACLAELRITRRVVRWSATAALVVAIALAPRLITVLSMCAVGIGSHAEGTAMQTVLLALFAHRPLGRSIQRTVVLWALVGLGVYLNKGTALVVPVLGAVEVALAWRSPRRIVAAVGGFVVGALPDLSGATQESSRGWLSLAEKAGNNIHAFPYAFLESIESLADYRIELLAAWGLAVVAGAALLVRFVRRSWAQTDAGAAVYRQNPPATLAIVLGVTLIHLLALAVMAQGPFDYYALHGYPTVLVLQSVLIACLCSAAADRWGETSATWTSALAIVLIAGLYRPDPLTWNLEGVSALWSNRDGAACSWRFGEGFLREHERGLAPASRTREQHAIDRCRSLSEPDQVLDCIGGIARALRFQGGTVGGEPAATGLTAAERLAYAYYYGVRRGGDAKPCADFESPELAAACAAAVQLDCLVHGDLSTRFFSGHALGPPRCSVTEPPMNGYWAALRLDLISRTGDGKPNLNQLLGSQLMLCKPLLDDACY